MTHTLTLDLAAGRYIRHLDQDAALAPEVYRHARGILGSTRVTIHTTDTHTGTIISHGQHAGTWTITKHVEPEPDPAAAVRGDGIRWGWTLVGLDRLARTVVSNNRAWWPAGDRDDLYSAAWHGIVEHLYATATEPRRVDLMEAGRRALADDVRDTMRHHGARRDTSNSGVKYATYWAWAGRAAPSPETAIVDRMAVEQILPTLTRGQLAAVHALAATGDYADAARLYGTSTGGLESQLTLARRRFRVLWHEGETPSRPWGCDRRAGSTRGTVGTRSAVARLRQRRRAEVA
ncbi:hypothetical protein LHJ74_14545 [Streptomyces sp. N2-109]|uniref:Uncharacterized protein n=1 Tax=Streptomyces gossypii TaxID=2883101 RepID=A0ABT2JTC8_9ACTN|nr:hypothetical protein [Streptomyces gossypii]MCT2591113.1 hypothetical protein [Streptomyces gossypii]